MTLTTNLGFPRIGARRELKHALESHWRGELSADQLHAVGRQLRARHWTLQRDAGIDLPPSNDFSLYDQVLDTAFLFDAIPSSHRALADADPLAGYFSLARGHQRDGIDLRRAPPRARRPRARWPPRPPRRVLASPGASAGCSGRARGRRRSGGASASRSPGSAPLRRSLARRRLRARRLTGRSPSYPAGRSASSSGR